MCSDWVDSNVNGEKDAKRHSKIKNQMYLQEKEKGQIKKG